jgi:hypothetical protein
MRDHYCFHFQEGTKGNDTEDQSIITLQHPRPALMDTAHGLPQVVCCAAIELFSNVLPLEDRDRWDDSRRIVYLLEY